MLSRRTLFAVYNTAECITRNIIKTDMERGDSNAQGACEDIVGKIFRAKSKGAITLASSQIFNKRNMICANAHS